MVCQLRKKFVKNVHRTSAFLKVAIRSKDTKIVDSNSSFEHRETKEAFIETDDKITFDQRSALEQSRDSYANSMYRKAIESTSSGLDEIIDKLLPLLDIRAASYGMAGYFEKGIRDAELLISLTPDMAPSYLQAGELCSLLGYQQRALKFYKQGLESVRSHDREILQQHYDEAKAKSEECVDIVGKSPGVIVSSIVNGFTLKEKLSLLNVSRVWRRQLSGCHSVWSTIEIDSDDELTPTDISLLMYAGSCIRAIGLFGIERELCETLFSTMQSESFCKVEDLWISECEMKDHAALIKALRCISKTLRCLEFDLPSNSVLPLKTIVSACPKLEYFCYYADQGILTKEIAGMLSFDTVSILTSLILAFAQIDISVIEKVLWFCPELRILDLRYCSSQIVQAVNLYCRKLHTFFFNDSHTANFVKRLEKPVPLNSRLRTLAIRIDDPRDFMSLFSHNHTTLNGSLRFTLDVSPDASWISLLNTFSPLNTIHYLELVCLDEDSCDAAALLLQKIPFITWLKFARHGILIGPELVNAIARLQSLQVLEMDATETTKQEMQTLFQRLAAKEETSSTLQKLIVTNRSSRSFPVDAIFENLPNISTLQELSLTLCPLDATNSIDTCFEKMQFHPSIQTILLDSVPGITDFTMRHIAAIRKLKHLEIRGSTSMVERNLALFNNSVRIVYD